MDAAELRSEIRRLVAIEALIGETVGLDATGRRWRGACPFHPDRERGLHVDDRGRAYRCYACLRQGDAVQWVMERDRKTESEVLEVLARHLGIG